MIFPIAIFFYKCACANFFSDRRTSILLKKNPVSILPLFRSEWWCIVVRFVTVVVAIIGTSVPIHYYVWDLNTLQTKEKKWWKTCGNLGNSGGKEKWRAKNIAIQIKRVQMVWVWKHKLNIYIKSDLDRW